jgi:hypothetical protein
MPIHVGGNGASSATVGFMPMQVIGIGAIGLGMITARSAASSVLRDIAEEFSDR